MITVSDFKYPLPLGGKNDVISDEGFRSQMKCYNFCQ